MPDWLLHIITRVVEKLLADHLAAHGVVPPGTGPKP